MAATAWSWPPPPARPAYALSCGGPIVDPRLDVLVVAPICPHTLSDRPIVVAGDSRIDIRLDRPARCQRAGHLRCQRARANSSLEAAWKSSPRGRFITLLHPPGYDYFRLLRSKLHWGLGGWRHER